MADHASMVEQVKVWQKLGEGHTNGWYHFVQKNGSRKLDPNRHDEALLEELFRIANDGRIDLTQEWGP